MTSLAHDPRASPLDDAPPLDDDVIQARFTPYLSRIQHEQDRVFFEEAVRAAGAGATRCAYLALWLSCSESLKRKFRDLAPRDGIAQRVVNELDKKEALHRSVDSYLLEEARSYGFLTHLEYAKLAHLYEMSCVYARPYEESPRLETMIAAASDVVDIVLSRATRLRHGYLKEQVRRITTDRAFLDDVHDSVTRFSLDVYGKAAEDLHLWFVQQLARSVESAVSDGGSPLLHRRGVWVVSAYLKAMAAERQLAGWDAIADLSSFPSVMPEALAVPELFASIPAHAQEIVVGHLLSGESRRIANLKRLEALHSAGLLNARQVERFTYSVESLPLPDVVGIGVHARYYAGALVQELKSRDWYRQNTAIEIMRKLGPDGVATVPEDLQRFMGSSMLAAADGAARDAIAWLHEIAESEATWPTGFIEGVMNEVLINERGAVRFKGKYAQEAFLALRTVPRPDRGEIVNRLARRIKEGTWVAKVYFRKEVEEIMAAIQKTLIIDEPRLQELRQLSQVLNALRTHQS